MSTGKLFSFFWGLVGGVLRLPCPLEFEPSLASSEPKRKAALTNLESLGNGTSFTASNPALTASLLDLGCSTGLFTNDGTLVFAFFTASA